MSSPPPGAELPGLFARELPSRDEMLRAFMERDASYEGIFLTAVRTTGIFCRPTCPARKPLPENVEFYATGRDALQAGYRPCRRCRPLEPAGTAPGWIRELLDEVDEDPARRWTDADLADRGLGPDRVRRWFRTHHGMTFHAYLRARRLGMAMGRIRHGDEILDAAYEHGYESLSGFNEAVKRLFGEPPGRARDAELVTVNRMTTPLGPMMAGATEDALVLLEFIDRRALETQLGSLRKRLGCVMTPGSNAVVDRMAAELGAYFAGELREFTVPLRTAGTDFQETVWAALRGIPYGTTASYGDVAREIGRPKAVRAVARANGDNRMAIVIPCHRVIGSDGSLTGYGGGLWRKRKLLELEGALG